MDSQLAYWHTSGTAKTFTHPVELGWLRGLESTARILDYGRT